PLRATALRALAEQYVPEVVDGLIDRLHGEPDSGRRRPYADLLGRVCKRPGPWTYWGYRPPSHPANTVAWERTDAMGRALDGALADPDGALRLLVLRRMQQDKVRPNLDALRCWLREEEDAARLAAILEALRDRPAAETLDLLQAVAAGPTKP